MKVSTKIYSTLAGLLCFLIIAALWNLFFWALLTFDTTLSYKSWYGGVAIPLTYVIQNALIGVVSAMIGISIYRKSRKLLVVSVLCLLFVMAELFFTLAYYVDVMDFLTG